MRLYLLYREYSQLYLPSRDFGGYQLKTRRPFGEAMQDSMTKSTGSEHFAIESNEARILLDKRKSTESD